ncbi:helix-turn-helix domain-containing protein [Gordonia sp. 'Campus']|uniref:helix-turn-helix domain-containing protein n=1 Tax=Gordonia sp. 'Campus' TaxID=2915824 RepID=UPI001EE3C8F4|nr:hypothetical protein [Gordonia sp. 'Campus']
MPNIDDVAKAWQLERSRDFGAALSKRRKGAGLTALQLSERTRELGFPISRVAISKIESNSRAGKLDIAELVVLAAALEIPPILLLYPSVPDGGIRVLPREEVASSVALTWFTGERLLPQDDEIELSESTIDALHLLQLIRERIERDRALGAAWLDFYAKAGDRVAAGERIAVKMGADGVWSSDDDEFTAFLNSQRQRSRELDAQIRLAGGVVDPTGRRGRERRRHEEETP